MKLLLRNFLVVLLFGVVGCGGPVSERAALQAAKDRFVKVCAGSHYDPASFVGPTKTTVGGVAFAYEWKEKAPNSDFGVLITVDDEGVTHVSTLGTLPQLRPKIK